MQGNGLLSLHIVGKKLKHCGGSHLSRGLEMQAGDQTAHKDELSEIKALPAMKKLSPFGMNLPQKKSKTLQVVTISFLAFLLGTFFNKNHRTLHHPPS